MRTLFQGVMVVAALTGAFACGDDSSGGSPQLSSGLPPALSLDDATAAQRESFCSTTADYLFAGRVGQRICVVVAAENAETPNECNDFVELCRDRLSDPEFSPVEEAAASCAAGMASEGCTATVEELESCLQEDIDAALAALSGVSCADAGDGSVNMDALLDSYEPSERCKAILGACPGLSFDIGSDDGGGSLDECCDPSDPCGFANDDFCDCSDQDWDAADCSASSQ